MSIKATPVARLAKSNLTVALTTEPGTVSAATGGSPAATGDRPVAYDKDEVVICDQDATTIAGPLSRDDAIALATAVLEGQRRAVTHPQLHLLLAGAVLAFVSAAPEPSRQNEEGTDGD